MRKALVAYYSRNGTTRLVADEVVAALNADFDAIEDPRDRAGVLGYMQSAVEAAARGLPAIRTSCNPRDYDLVILGTPVWVGTMASPMRSYLFMYRRQLRNIACFCTMGGRGGDLTLKEMAALCDTAAPPTLCLSTSEVRHRRHRQKLDAFIDQLRREISQTVVAAE